MHFNGTDARAVRPYMPLAHKSSYLSANPKVQCSKLKVQRQLTLKFNIQSSKAANLKVQYSKLKVQRQSPHIAISAILRDNSCAEVIQDGPRCGTKKYPCSPKRLQGNTPCGR